MDYISIFCILLLSGTGVLLVRTATNHQEMVSNLWVKQLLWVFVGLVIYFILSNKDYHSILDFAGYLYVLGIISLILLMIFATPVNGAKSWFKLPFMSIQPSELVKVTTLLFLTKYFSKFQERQSSFIEFLGSGLLVGLPLILVLLQPDLGTAFLFLPFFLLPNFLSGNKEILYVTFGGLLLVAILILGVVYKPDWVFFLKDYQKARISSFVFPEEDVSNKGYQVHQAKITIGQGGLLGAGLGKGKQTHTGFLPAQHTDCILAVAAEELGFIGILIILLLFLVLFVRSVTTALQAADTAGSMLVVLVLGTLSLQMLFNAGMMIGFVPTTGIPCPLLSYGGSSALSTLTMLGLIQSVKTHRYIN